MKKIKENKKKKKISRFILCGNYIDEKGGGGKPQ